MCKMKVFSGLLKIGKVRRSEKKGDCFWKRLEVFYFLFYFLFFSKDSFIKKSEKKIIDKIYTYYVVYIYYIYYLLYWKLKKDRNIKWFLTP